MGDGRLRIPAYSLCMRKPWDCADLLKSFHFIMSTGDFWMDAFCSDPANELTFVDLPCKQCWRFLTLFLSDFRCVLSGMPIRLRTCCPMKQWMEEAGMGLRRLWYVQLFRRFIIDTFKFSIRQKGMQSSKHTLICTAVKI